MIPAWSKRVNEAVKRYIIITGAQAQEVAAKMGVSPSSLCCYRNGTAKPLSADIASRISSLLGIPDNLPYRYEQTHAGRSEDFMLDSPDKLTIEQQQVRVQFEDDLCYELIRVLIEGGKDQWEARYIVRNQRQAFIDEARRQIA